MTTNTELIAIASSAGDPKNPKTWSGTPSNIARAIESLGIQVVGINTDLKKYQKLTYKLLNQLSGLKIDYRRGKVARTHGAKILEAQAQALGCTKILHTGTFDLPFPQVNNQFEHYLFCDSTWNLWSNYVTNIAKYTPKMLQLADRLERESYAQINHFFPISEYVRQNLIDYYQIEPERITVVGTGRGKIEPFTGEKDYENGHILFVAKNRFEDKGGSLLIEGFQKALQKNPSLQLVIVGQEKYKKLIGSVPNVRVTGFISWKELQRLFERAALFAMPALNEPWGIVYLEALACRTPILGLNRNSLPEIIHQEKYGFLVDEPTSDAIAESILRAFSDPNRLRAMGIAGQQYCLEKFSWERVARKIAEVMLLRYSKIDKNKNICRQ
ncbi:glycosyltransferase family 4 protein [Myxosarcina sp. GI1(2024)]